MNVMTTGTIRRRYSCQLSARRLFRLRPLAPPRVRAAFLLFKVFPSPMFLFPSGYP